MTDQNQKEYSPEVVFGPIIEEPMRTSDWRWQEILALEPFKVMEELKELDTALFAARSEQREAVRELADLEDVLYRAKQEALEGIQEPDLRAKLFKGGTKDERKERQEMHLADLDWVQQSEVGIKAARERKDNAQVALDSMLDRQVNLGKFANMYSATARLLANIRAPEPTVIDLRPQPVLEDEVLDAMEAAGVEMSEDEGVILAFAQTPARSIHPAISSVYEDAQEWSDWFVDGMRGKPPLSTLELADRVAEVLDVKVAEAVGEEEKMATAGLRSLFYHIILVFASQPANDIHPAISSVYEEAQAWAQWSRDAEDPPLVDMSALVRKIMQVTKPMQASPDLEPISEDEALDAMEAGGIEIPVEMSASVDTPNDHDEEEHGEVEIPASMDMSGEVADAVKAAIERHREVSEEALPFQPDEDLSL